MDWNVFLIKVLAPTEMTCIGIGLQERGVILGTQTGVTH